MRLMNLRKLLSDIAQRAQESARIPLFLTLPQDLPSFFWSDRSLEILISTLIDDAISTGEKPIRIAVVKRMKICDLEGPLKIHPSYWIQLRIDVQSFSGAVSGVQEEFDRFDYRGEEECATGDSRCRLNVYSRANQPEPPILLWIHDRKANHRYIFLIPVNDPASNER